MPTRSGVGPAAVLNQDNSVNSASNPAPRGAIIQIYATGECETSPHGVTGSVIGTGLKTPLLGVKVTIGGQDAVVQYAGSAGASVAGGPDHNLRWRRPIAERRDHRGAMSASISHSRSPRLSGGTVPRAFDRVAAVGQAGLHGTTKPKSSSRPVLRKVSEHQTNGATQADPAGRSRNAGGFDGSSSPPRPAIIANKNQELARRVEFRPKTASKNWSGRVLSGGAAAAGQQRQADQRRNFSCQFSMTVSGGGATEPVVGMMNRCPSGETSN